MYSGVNNDEVPARISPCGVNVESEHWCVSL